MAQQRTVEERTEEEYSRDLSRAVADTEDEIFTEALGDEELENDGDTSLEDEEEGWDGESEEDADEAEEAEGETLRTAPEEEAEGEEEPEPELQLQAPPEQQPQRGIPSARLREEAEARRQAEERAVALERELATMRGRVDELSTRVNAPQQPQQQQRPPKPDMFSDPEGYERWMMDEAERRAEDRLNARMGDFQRQQQQMHEQRLNLAFASAAQGDRGFEFNEAYRRLTQLDPNNQQHRALVQGIVYSPDPTAALFNWWESNGGPEYRDHLLQQLMPREGRQQRRQGPVHETRVPPGVRRPPSLNAAAGGGRQAIMDPDMLDDSDSAVFRYATR